ncbi:unnamed protein product, partial [Symbiodinium sp. CCMP2456]
MPAGTSNAPSISRGYLAQPLPAGTCAGITSLIMQRGYIPTWKTKVVHTFLEFEEEEEGKQGRRSVSVPPRVCQHHSETELPEEKLPEVQLPNAPVAPSPLNPHAAPFTGVSGEPQFGTESGVYFPFQEYTVEEWLFWIYHLQTNRVLLTPEYAAYICEVARLLGIPSTEHEEPQNVHIYHMERPGSYLVKWYVDSRKLRSNDKQENPDANFKKSDGRGMFQLKCDTPPKDHGCLPCRFGFSVSNGEMRTASGQFTLSNCVVDLPTEEST